jgi:type I restriction-modification system DNA methylase subunit
MNIQKLQNLWFENKERYLKAEKGSKGNEGFTKEFLTQIFGLSENNDGKIKFGTFRNQHGTGQKGRTADFVLYCSEKVIIPLEVEKLGNLEAGSIQILNYQSDLDTKYGILTDGLKWLFFYGKKTKVFDLEVEIFKNPEDFITFWQDYINSESFYQSYFSGNEQDGLFEIKYKVDENREKYFQSTTQIVHDFKTKLIQKGFTPKEGLFENTDKKATELAYSYLIQFILFKTLVDNKYLDSEYARYINLIKESLETKNYGKIIKVVKQITDTVGSNIYKPFFNDQDDINEQIKILLESLDDPEINDVTLFLDIIIYIDKYDFSGLGGDIFGYIYENYLKELYSDENKGQYFTDPNIAELMLVEMGWSVENLVEKIKNKEGLSLIDPACGSGTFLYSAVKTLIKAGQKANLESVKIINLVVENIVGFDVEEFPLYLAEMNILMRLLPLIYEDLDNPTPVEKRLKIFWTEDSLSEFTDIASYNQGLVRDQNTNPLFEPVPSQFHKFMRDEKDLKKLKEELLDTKRQKFDFVIANPPYIGYNESSKMGIKYFKQIRNKEVKLNDVFGVNLHSTPDRHKKYSPKPNLYAFFLALNNALLKSDGIFSFIIPQTLLTAGDLDVLRYFISKNFKLQKLITFQNNLFIDRGVKQTKKVATSSLVIVAQKV